MKHLTLLALHLHTPPNHIQWIANCEERGREECEGEGDGEGCVMCEGDGEGYVMCEGNGEGCDV